MRNLFFIKRLAAGLMLLFFLSGIIPKKYLHDIVANHPNQIIIPAKSISFETNNPGKICTCDDLFVQPIFTVAENRSELTVFPFYNQKEAAFTGYLFSHARFSVGLRGPPAI